MRNAKLPKDGKVSADTAQAYFDEPMRQRPEQFIAARMDKALMTDDELLKLIDIELCALERYKGIKLGPESGLWQESIEQYKACRAVLNRRLWEKQN